jgi:phosphohistidine phosphatase
MELDPGARKQDLKTLRKRQDLYGRFQDLHIQLELLEQFRKEAPETLPEAVAGIIDLIGQEKADTRRQILAMGGLGLG